MSNEQKRPADADSVQRPVRPVCYGDGFGYGEPRMTNRYKYRLFTQAELDAAVAAESKAEEESRQMFAARLENVQKNGDHWITVTEVLAMLSDCSMLAQRPKDTPTWRDGVR